MLLHLQTLLHFIPPILHSFSFWDLLLSIFYKKSASASGVLWSHQSAAWGNLQVSWWIHSPLVFVKPSSPQGSLSPASKFAACKSTLENKPALYHKPCPPQHCLLTPHLRLQSWNQVLQDSFANIYKTERERSCNSTAIFIILPFQGEDNLKLKQLELGLSNQLVKSCVTWLTRISAMDQYQGACAARGCVKLMRLSDKFTLLKSVHIIHTSGSCFCYTVNGVWFGTCLNRRKLYFFVYI